MVVGRPAYLICFEDAIAKIRESLPRILPSDLGSDSNHRYFYICCVMLPSGQHALIVFAASLCKFSGGLSLSIPSQCHRGQPHPKIVDVLSYTKSGIVWFLT